MSSYMPKSMKQATLPGWMSDPTGALSKEVQPWSLDCPCKNHLWRQPPPAWPKKCIVALTAIFFFKLSSNNYERQSGDYLTIQWPVVQSLSNWNAHKGDIKKMLPLTRPQHKLLKLRESKPLKGIWLSSWIWACSKWRKTLPACKRWQIGNR